MSKIIDLIGCAAAPSGAPPGSREAIDKARRHGYTAIASHRSGETGDTTFADR